MSYYQVHLAEAEHSECIRFAACAKSFLRVFCRFREKNTLLHQWICCFLALVLSLLSASLHAADEVSTIKQASLSLQDNSYVLSAEINYYFSKKALNALQNGVPLFWIVQVEVQEQHDLLWNRTLAEKEIRYRLQYHALLNMYRVKNESSGEVYNFSTLSAALDLMSNIRDFPVISSGFINLKKNQYRAAMRVLFNRNALPLPLRTMAYLNPQWYLSSEWSTWSLTK
ncbi:DUF4390 domain-containing protein [Crenothrix sp.]|uniref:DUF4390 domain-containing protein n=1 Tax=Crenothrix sp. TaxID=3100433 RepID=UPI00374D750A